MLDALPLFCWIAVAVVMGVVSNKLSRWWVSVFIGLLFGAFVLSLSWQDVVAQPGLAARLMTLCSAAFFLSVLGAMMVVGPFLAGRYLVRAVFAVSGGRYGGALLRSRT